MSSAAPEPKANLGPPGPRVAARLKVTGGAMYASDFDLANTAYAYLLTSAIAKGTIKSIDQGEARKVDGVIDILTHENMADAIKQVPFAANGGPASTSLVPLASPKIVHDGQIVAMVVADRYEAAREAAYKLVVAYDEERPSATFGSPGVTERPYTEGRTKQKHENPVVGAFQAAFAAAPVKVEADYAT